MPRRVLVVDADSEALGITCRQLLRAGYFVNSSSTFEGAKEQLRLWPPDLLIADVRLGAFNGVHLIVRSRVDRPDMPAILLDSSANSALAAEARHVAASYLVKPIDQAELLRVVSELLAGRPAHPATTVPRRWPRTRAGLTASLWGSEATVWDVSYGGLRLEVRSLADAEERLSSDGEICLPVAGLSLPFRPVWAKRAGKSGSWWCGIEVFDADQPTAAAWCTFVDQLT